MSTGAPRSDRTTTAVLLALWDQPETTLQSLATQTQTPASTVRDALEALRRQQCHIEETPTTIRLAATGLPCWRDILEELARRKDLHIGRNVRVYVRTGSTNDLAWQAAGMDLHGLLVIADEQTAGRGRMGHLWASKPRQSILLSVWLQEIAAGSIDRLTLLAGLATAQAVESAVQSACGRTLRIQIKWPNDLLIDGRKLAGILVERRADAVVIGIGINVAQATADFAPDLATRATSIYQATGLLADRLRIIAALVEQLDSLCLAHGPFSAAPADCVEAWLADWKSRCPMLSSRLCARSNDRLISGVVLDVDPLRGLLLRDDAGANHWLSAQTTSLAP